MADKPNGGRPAGSTRKSPEAERRAFASAMARAELGRYYWSEQAERDLQEARKKRPPKPKS